jgi:hypothetical protein
MQFSCELCTHVQFFESEAEFSCHKEKFRFQCFHKECNKHFESKGLRNSHYTKVHQLEFTITYNRFFEFHSHDSDHKIEIFTVKRGQQERYHCRRCDYYTDQPDVLQDHASHCTSKPRSVLLDLVLTELHRITIVRRPFSVQTAISRFHNWPFTTFSFIVVYVFSFAWGVS